MAVSVQKTDACSPFREWLRDLPTEIAKSEAREMPIVVPDPCTDHGRALLRTLGAWVAEFQIERVKPDMYFGKWLQHWKDIRADGWDVTTLVDRSNGTVIAMASRIVRP